MYRKHYWIDFFVSNMSIGFVFFFFTIRCWKLLRWKRVGERLKKKRRSMINSHLRYILTPPYLSITSLTEMGKVSFFPSIQQKNGSISKPQDHKKNEKMSLIKHAKYWNIRKLTDERERIIKSKLNFEKLKKSKWLAFFSSLWNVWRNCDKMIY